MKVFNNTKEVYEEIISKLFGNNGYEKLSIKATLKGYKINDIDEENLANIKAYDDFIETNIMEIDEDVFVDDFNVSNDLEIRLRNIKTVTMGINPIEENLYLVAIMETIPRLNNYKVNLYAYGILYQENNNCMPLYFLEEV